MGITYNDIFESFTKDVLKNVDKNREEIKKDIVYIYPFKEFLDELKKFFIEIGAKKIDIAIHNVKFSRYISLSFSHIKSEYILVELEHDMREWEEDSFYAYYQPPVKNPSPNVYVTPIPHRFDIFNDKNYKVSEYDNRRKWYPRTYGNLQELKKWIKSYYEWRTEKNKNSVVESFTSNVIKKTKETTQEEKRNDIIQIHFEDPLVENICNSHGVYTYKDAANVEDVEGWFNETTIKSFKEFVYFTGVKELHSGTFEECVNLEHIVLPENIETIGNYAFIGCERLQEIHFPKNCTYIGRSAFYDCHSLKIVEIPENILSIESYVFAYCKNLEKVIYKSNFNQIPPYMFEGTINLKEFKLLSSLCQSIGQGAFECSGIEYIELPNNIIRIEDKAFSKSGLKSIKMDGVGTIQDWAFEKCLFETIRLPESLKEIGDYVFERCPNLQNVYFLNNFGDDPIRRASQSIFLNSDNIKNVYVNGKNESLVYYLLKVNFNRKKEHRYKLIDLNTNQEIKKRIYEDEPIDESFTSKVINNHKKIKQEEKRGIVSEYVDLRLPSGNLWCKCNVGANSEEEFGNYYKHHEAVELSNNVDVLPRNEDFEELLNERDNCIKEWTNINGINGIMFTSKINGNTLFFPAGGCNPENNLQYNEIGNYWSETVCAISENRSFYLKFDKDHVYTFHMHNSNSFNVRMIKKNNKMHESFTSKVIDKSKEITQEEKRNELLQIQFEDPEVEKICHEHGVYTIDDAKKVETLRYNNNGYIESWFKEKPIKSFKEFKYFTGLRRMDYDSFYGCKDLQRITLPNGIGDIGNQAFAKCISLESIIIPTSVKVINGGAFQSTGLKSLILPGNVKSIGMYTFYYCKDLKNVIIQEGFNTIYDAAFSTCQSLEYIKLPDSLIKIGEKAFDRCDNLKTIYISKNHPLRKQLDKEYPVINLVDPNDVNESFTSNVIKKTKENATNDKIKNTLNIEFEDPEVERVCNDHGVYTYKDAENCLSIKEWFIDQHQIKKFNELKYFINLENNAIPRRCFDWCDSLEEVTLPENTKIIDEYAFVWCKSLKSIKIPYGCRSIMNHAFNNVRDLTDIYIPSTVERLPLTFNFLYECTNYGAYSLDFLTIHISPDYVYRKKIEKWNERYDFNIAYDY